MSVSDGRYFLVTHKYTKETYKAKDTSKNKLKKSLPRFCEERGYRSLWDIEEISGVQYFNKRELPNAPYKD